MATFNDVQTDPIGGFLGGVLNSDKQHYSDLNKQQDLMTDALNNVKLKTTVSEFLRDAPTREAEDQLKMAQARAKLPMVQEMLNADLEGKKADAAYKSSHGRLFGQQADNLDYSNAATRLDAINQLLKKLPPEQALEMRTKLNPVMQTLMQRMTGRTPGEFVGSNELEATASAGVNTPDHQRALDKKFQDYEKALAVAQARGESAQSVALINAMARITAAGMRGAGGKLDPTSFKAQLDAFNKSSGPASIAKGMGILAVLNDENDPSGQIRANVQARISAQLQVTNADPTRQPPADAAKGSKIPDPRGQVPGPKQGDLPAGVTRDD